MEIKTDCDDIRMEWADDIKIEVKAEDVKSEIEDGEGDDIKVEVKEEDTKTEVQDYKNQCKEENVKDFLCISWFRLPYSPGPDPRPASRKTQAPLRTVIPGHWH